MKIQTFRKLITLALCSMLLLGLLPGLAQSTRRAEAAASVAANGRSQSIEPGQTPAGLTTGEWDRIQAQIAAGHYCVYAADKGSYISSNPAQDWQISYGADGATTLTLRGSVVSAWRWGLQLISYGYGENRQNFENQPDLEANGHTLTYRWNANLSEWWVNTANGLEQGFTLQARPAEANGQPLVVKLAVSGDLTAAKRGQAIAFIDSSGAVAFTYDKLVVTDIAGQSIPAQMTLTGDGIRIEVDDVRAVYPLTIDPLIQQAYLKASNTEASDNFGYAVAISGDTMVVGTPFEDSNATGVNGNQADNSASAAGAAYVFVRSGATWSQQAYLKASNTGASDHFGRVVAISGDTLVVGADGEDSRATGVNGNQADNSFPAAGAVYVFVRSGTTWSQQAYLKASNTELTDYFGFAVAISGDTVVVGAYAEDSNATGVNGDQADNSAVTAGAAYVFVRNGTTWLQQAYLKASNTDASDYFGRAVAISGDTVVVGAIGEASSATGVDGNQADNSATYAGAVYVFARSGATWSQQAYLKASSPDVNDYFGETVAISGDTVVVGAYQEDSNATGVNGNQMDNSASAAGAAYVFVRGGAAWSQQAYLKASNSGASDAFGCAVAISGDTVVVGAETEDSNATGVNGNQADISATMAGAAYVFVRSGITWSQQAYLKASNTDSSDRFGGAVAISGDTVVVGADGEDSSATGVDGDQADNSAATAGAAYVFVEGFCSQQSGVFSNPAIWRGGVVPGSSDLACVSSGHTVMLDTDVAVNRLLVNPGAALDLSTYAITAQDTVTNRGAISQIRTVGASSTVEFLRIRDSGNTTDKYRGLDITTGAGVNLGATTVRVMGDTTICNNHDGGAYRDRCFYANPTGSGSATITLYTTPGEDDLADDAFFQYISDTTWVERATCNDAVGGGGTCTGTAIFASPAWFLIGSSSSDPTAVEMRVFLARGTSPSLSVFILAGVLLACIGLYIWRPEKSMIETTPSPLITQRETDHIQ
jgi:hypothetical protein